MLTFTVATTQAAKAATLLEAAGTAPCVQILTSLQKCDAASTIANNMSSKGLAPALERMQWSAAAEVLHSMDPALAQEVLAEMDVAALAQILERVDASLLIELSNLLNSSKNKSVRIRMHVGARAIAESSALWAQQRGK